MQDYLRSIGIAPDLYDLEMEIDPTLHYDENLKQLKEKFGWKEPWELLPEEKYAAEIRAKELTVEEKYKDYMEHYPDFFALFQEHFNRKNGRMPSPNETVDTLEESLKKYRDPVDDYPLTRIYFILMPGVEKPTEIDIPDGFFYYQNAESKRHYRGDGKLALTDPIRIYRDLFAPPPPRIPAVPPRPVIVPPIVPPAPPPAPPVPMPPREVSLKMPPTAPPLVPAPEVKEKTIEEKYADFQERYPDWIMGFEDQYDYRFHTAPSIGEVVVTLENALKTLRDPVDRYPLVRINSIGVTFPGETFPRIIDILEGFFYYVNPKTRRYYEGDKKLTLTDPLKIYRKVKPPAPPKVARVVAAPAVKPEVEPEEFYMPEFRLPAEAFIPTVPSPHLINRGLDALMEEYDGYRADPRYATMVETWEKDGLDVWTIIQRIRTAKRG